MFALYDESRAVSRQSWSIRFRLSQSADRDWSLLHHLFIQTETKVVMMMMVKMVMMVMVMMVMMVMTVKDRD